MRRLWVALAVLSVSGIGVPVLSSAPASAATLSNVVQVSAGGGHTCARLSDGTARCWGLNYSGQLGDGTTTNRKLPVVVKEGAGPLRKITAISAGDRFTCAVISDGSARCWGSNANGRLGIADSFVVRKLKPALVRWTSWPLEDVTAIDAGTSHVCARHSDGTAHCWGAGGAGQLGNGEEEDWYAPTTVMKSGSGTGLWTLRGIAAISAGDGYTCAVISDGTALCWGAGGSGELGNGTNYRFSLPVVVRNVAGTGALHNVAGIQTGTGFYAHTCARISDGTARCWGANDHGELGDGTTGIDRWLPVVVKNVAGTGALHNVKAISAGESHTCAVISDGTARCWGDNSYGRLGDGTEDADRLLPVVVKNVAGAGPLPKVTAISAGNAHSCARVSYAQARCWGWNSTGQLGDGTTGTDRLLPVTVG